MTKPINYIGQKIGMIEITGRAENSSTSATRWFVTCECGNEGVVLFGNRIQKGQDHCGCQFTGLSKNNHERVRVSRRKQCIDKNGHFIHPVINEFLYHYRRKYAQMRTYQWHGPLPEARYCQIPSSTSPDRLEIYLRGLR